MYLLFEGFVFGIEMLTSVLGRCIYIEDLDLEHLLYYKQLYDILKE